MSLKHALPGPVGDAAGGRVDFHMIPGSGLGGGLGAFQDGESDVDRVAEEDPGEGRSDHGAYARRPNGDRGMLPRGAASEVFAGHDDIARLHPAGKRGVNVLHAVAAQFPGIRCVQVSGGYDPIRVDVITEFEDCTGSGHLSVLPLHGF